MYFLLTLNSFICGTYWYHLYFLDRYWKIRIFQYLVRSKFNTISNPYFIWVYCSAILLSRHIEKSNYRHCARTSVVLYDWYDNFANAIRLKLISYAISIFFYKLRAITNKIQNYRILIMYGIFPFCSISLDGKICVN